MEVSKQVRDDQWNVTDGMWHQVGGWPWLVNKPYFAWSLIQEKFNYIYMSHFKKTKNESRLIDSYWRWAINLGKPKTPMTKCLVATKMFTSSQGWFEGWQYGNGFVTIHSDIWSQDTSLNQMGHFQCFADSFLSGLNNIMSFPIFRFYYFGIYSFPLQIEIKHS